MRSMVVALFLLVAGPAHAGAYGKEASAAYGKTGAAEVAVGKRLSVTAPVVVGDLAVYPVIDRGAAKRPEADYVPLSDALRTGQVVVTEASVEGDVNRLRVVNRGKEPVLAMAGQVLHGGRQDRVIRTDRLIAAVPGPQLVDVVCVEQGRWQGGGSFAFAGRADLALRRAVEVQGSQEATWSQVAAANADLGRAPATGTYLAAMQASRTEDARRAEHALREALADKRIVGLVVARGGSFEGSELYGHPALFEQHASEVIRSHAPAAASSAVAVVPSTQQAASYVRGLIASSGPGTRALADDRGVVHASTWTQ